MSDEERDRPSASDEPAAEESAPTEPTADAPADSPHTAVPSEDAAAAETAAVGESAEDEAAKAAREAAEKAAAAKAKAEAAAKAKAAREAAEAAKPPWLRDPAVPEWSDSEDDPLVAALRETHGEAIEAAATFADELTVTVRAAVVDSICADLRDAHGFDMLVDVCGVDFAEREPRFEVVYHLYSFAANRRIRLKVGVDEGVEVPTVCGVWRAANWPEREVYDMYGVRFSGHPDMTRILLWEGFNGYPLRKDFPVEGVDTGAAIYPEFYTDDAGPVAGTGTGWRPPEPEEPADESTSPDEGGES
jgi:NADH-quinone oxidoreductase subunit C